MQDHFDAVENNCGKKETRLQDGFYFKYSKSCIIFYLFIGLNTCMYNVPGVTWAIHQDTARCHGYIIYCNVS